MSCSLAENARYQHRWQNRQHQYQTWRSRIAYIGTGQSAAHMPGQYHSQTDSSIRYASTSIGRYYSTGTDAAWY
eukprot:3745982-Rhodomonas_salina.2